VIEAIATGCALGLGSGVAPGPLTGLTISTTMRAGFKAGLRIAIAPLLSDSIIIALSLTLVSQLPPSAISVLGIVGAVVVALFGIEILVSARKAQTPVPGNASIPHRLDRFPIALQGAAVNLLNPAPWIFWVTAGSTLLVEYWRENPITAIAFIVVFYVFLIGVKIAIVVSLSATRHKMNTRTYRAVLLGSGSLLLVAALLLVWTHAL
jgi:threonine/homoserine/homoserine lactone efflux protein